MSNTDNRWVRAANEKAGHEAFRSIEALAREVVRRARVSGPTPRALATYLGKPSAPAWLAKHPAHAKALSDITGLPNSALAGPGAAISFHPLLKRPLDPRVEATPDIVDLNPLDFLVQPGLMVIQIPSGCGHHFWTEVIRGLAAATVFDHIPLADDVIARSRSGPVLVSVESVLNDQETQRRIKSLALLPRRVLVLATEVAPPELQEAYRSWPNPYGHPYAVQLKLRPHWRETMTNWLCARAREEKKQALSAAAALRWLETRDPKCQTVATPRDLIDTLALLELYPASGWQALSVDRLADDDDDADPAAIFSLVFKEKTPRARARELLQQMVQVARRRAEEVSMPLSGPMSSEAWKRLTTEFEPLRDAGLFRKTRAWLYAALPEVLLVEDAKVHLRKLVKRGVTSWGLLCLDEERRAVIEEELLRCALPAFEAIVRTSNQSPSDDLGTVAAQDVLFSVVARRAERGERVDETLAHTLLRRTSLTWVKRYSTQTTPKAPVTRAGPETGGNDAAFIADCVAWSLHWPRPELTLPPGLFPGWEKLSWADLPSWWGHFSRGHGSGIERLAALCGELVKQKKLSGTPNFSELPPLFLPFFVGQLSPRTPAAQSLLSRPGDLKAAVDIDATQAWRLALATGINSGLGWMKNADVLPDAAFAAALDELPRESLESVALQGLPRETWYLLVPALLKDDKRQHEAVEAIRSLIFQESTEGVALRLGDLKNRDDAEAVAQVPTNEAPSISERLLSLVELAVRDCVQQSDGELAVQLLWLNAPARARRHLERELDLQTSVALRWLAGTPTERMREALTVLQGRRVEGGVRAWLLRVLLRNPAVAEDAWAILRAAEPKG